MATLSRRTLLVGSLAAAYAGRASAQTWPAGPIKIVVPFPPGGSVDAIARLVQNGLGQRLGTNIIIENRSGGSGSAGSLVVAKAPADGNTWLFVFDNHAVNPFVLPSLPYDTEKDFAPVLLIGTAPHVVCTHPSKPYKTLADVIAAAKAKPKSITYGTISAGSLGHLTMELLSRQAGIQLVHVPYRGGGPLVNDGIAGHIDLVIGSAALVNPQVQAGRLRPIVQTGKARASALANVPTVIDAGFPGFESTTWWGVFAPAGTPEKTIQRFSADLAATLREPAAMRQITENQLITPRLGGPAELRAFVTEQMRIWGTVAKESGIKIDG